MADASIIHTIQWRRIRHATRLLVSTLTPGTELS